MTIAQVVEDSSLPRGEWKFAIRDTRVLMNGENVPVELASVENYEDLGHSGSLSLTFVDSLLVKAWYEPSFPNEYIRDLEREWGRKISIDTHIGGSTVVWVWKENGRAKAIGWRDLKLEERFATSS